MKLLLKLETQKLIILLIHKISGKTNENLPQQANIIISKSPKHSDPTQLLKKVQSDSPYQHPEASYVLKYAPKYYENLTLQASFQSPFLSKVKKIKKLKGFTGHFDRHFPQKLWFNLLANNRKEMEEDPQISCNNRNISPTQSLWKKLDQQKLKHFWNLTKIWLPKWKEDSYLVHDLDNFLSSKKSFVKHICYLRKLKSLKITVKDDNYDNIKWVLERLDGMEGLFKRLEILTLNVVTDSQNIQELFQQNKTFFSHLTGIDLSVQFDPIFAEIPQICKNLNSSALNFHMNMNEIQEFRSLLGSVQKLTRLKYLEFGLPSDEKSFWKYFKPQASLEYFRLRFDCHDLVQAGFFEEDDLVGHWEDLKSLRLLEFSVTSASSEEFNLVRIFMTKVLKKVQKLEELKIWIGTPLNEFQETKEPIIVEEVFHLYESLEKFEYGLRNTWEEYRFIKLNLNSLLPFKTLKSLQIAGNLFDSCENIEEIVRLLERNQKEGECPVLEFKFYKSIDSPADWMRKTLGILEKIKRNDKNLRVIIELTFELKGFLETLEKLCYEIQSAKMIKGLRICLNFNDNCYFIRFPVEEIRELLSKSAGIRNLSVLLSSGMETLEFVQIDGEKEQLFVNRY